MRGGRIVAGGCAAGIALLLALGPIAGAQQPLQGAAVGAAEDREGELAGQVLPNGRRLDRHRLPVAVLDGVIELSGARAWVWSEPDGRDPGAMGDAGATRRVMLSGDVQVRLGMHTLSARRALVWMAPLPEDDPEAGAGVWQVFLYLEEGRTVGGSAVAVSGARVPVRAILRTPRDVQLVADAMQDGRPVDPFVAEGEAALAERLQRWAARQSAEVARDAGLVAGAVARPPADWPLPIFAADGILTVAAGDSVRSVPAEEETSVIAMGGVNLQYWDRARDSTLQLSAQRAVVFLDPGPAIDHRRFNIERVRGFYLEGDVLATDGQYTVRAPRVYYNVRENSAVLVDAVFWTYNQRLGMPLYLRARMLRQLEANRFRATSAMLTNTAFFDPDLAIGASSVTLTRTPEAEGMRNHLDARHITLRAGGFPFFYTPILRGDPDAIPLRGLGFASSRGAGTVVQSSWNMYSLIGLDAPDGHDATLLFDWFFDRGPALGLDYRWAGPTFQGGFFAYGLPSDQGEDFLLTGARQDPPQAMRGVVTMQHRAALDDRWTFLAEGAYISDPTVLHALFGGGQWDRERREARNAMRLQRMEDNALLRFEASARMQDFLVNDYLMQTPGYSVDKLPEVMYFRAADDLLRGSPGLLTWTHEYRAGVLRMNFHEPTARELGVVSPDAARAFWGISPDESPADVLRMRGLHEDPVLRFDTRHELTMPLKAGPVNITPFAVGRATVYDQDFDALSPEMNDPYRLWGAAGVALSTELVRISNTINSRLFDLHRVRHIVRPNMTLWHAASTVNREHLPVFDADVEDLADGSAVRFGVDQVWQTQRGGPGRWRSVDVFRLNSELVISSGEIVRKSPNPRFFDFRPEYGNLGGMFGSAEAAWQVTEIMGLGGELVYDFEIDRIARTALGATLQHTPEFSIYAELRYVGAQDQTFMNVGAAYELTRKYTVSFGTSYDTDQGEFSTLGTQIQRRFPNVILGVGISHNNISGDTSFGLILQPVGIGIGGAQVQEAGGAFQTGRRGGPGR